MITKYQHIFHQFIVNRPTMGTLFRLLEYALILFFLSASVLGPFLGSFWHGTPNNAKTVCSLKLPVELRRSFVMQGWSGLVFMFVVGDNFNYDMTSAMQLPIEGMGSSLQGTSSCIETAVRDNLGTWIW